MAVDTQVAAAGLQAQNKTSEKPGFEEQSGPVSRLFLNWFTKLLRVGTKKLLQQEDLGRPHPVDDGIANFERMQLLWETEVQASGLEKARLGRVLYRHVGSGRLAFIAVSAYVAVLLTTAQPFANKMLLEWLEGSLELDSVQVWGLAAVMFLVPLCASFLQAHVQMISSRLGLHLYASLTQMIYRKSLRLSSPARSSASTGRMVNLMSNDAGTTMENAVKILSPALTAFPQLVVVLVMLSSELGVSMLSGFGFILLSVPLTIVVFVKVGSMYGLAAHEADTRLKLTNDLFVGIRVVKAYAWEKAFLRMIGDVRTQELKFIRKHAYWSMLGMMCVYMQLPALMQLVVYSTYVGLGGMFTASRIFTVIQLFQLLQQPLSQLPAALTQLSQLHTAVVRLSAFFRLHELDEHADDLRIVTPAVAGEMAIEVSDDAVFVWESADVESWRLGLPQSKAEKAQERSSKKKGKAGSPTKKELEADKAVAAEVEEDGKAAQESDDVKPAGFAVAVADSPDTHADAADGGFELRHVGLRVAPGELVAIVGPVGCGKSSMLSAVLNEMMRQSGSVTTRGRVAYAGQQAWIQNATLRDNILFGLPYEAEWYAEVVNACALVDDMAMLADEDRTEIGERGINLSGGQKARVNLARAVYSRADLVLLDDPLAAVDMHVGDTLFEQCIRGVLKDKTVLLVTNQLHRLEHVDRIVSLQNGKIAEIGSHAELMAARGQFADLLERQGITTQATTATACTAITKKSLRSTVGPLSGSEKADVKGKDASQAAKLIEEESKEVGYVEWNVYTWFIKKCGLPLFMGLAFFSTLQCYFPVLGTFVLAAWTQDVQENGHDKERNYGWLQWYGLFLAGGFLSAVCSSTCSAEARVAGARSIHRELLRSVSRATVSFFDVTPIGRILNRFSKDLLGVDHQVMMMISWAFIIANFVLSSCAAVIVSTRGWMLVLIVPTFLFYMRIFKFVRHSAIQLQRMESTTRSPLASTFQEILVGLSTVRAYQQQARFQATNSAMINQNIVPHFLSRTAQPAWLTMRLNCIGAMVSGACAAYAVASETLGGKQTAGLAGLGLTYSGMISHTMLISIMIMVQVETMMNSVERIKEYATRTDSEAAEHVPGVLDNEPEWPVQGRLTFQTLVMGYRQGPNVLHGISANIEPCEKIGIVGRTGSGKSTIILSIFRLIEPRSGTILIDGVDITKIGLEQLRSSIGLIPQDPVMFSGTVRYNLDPFSEATDERLWEVLKAVRMDAAVERLANKLSQDVQEGGGNFSVGERQLFCIARALLRNPRILCLDEATASVDSDTDAMLQDMIRTLFAKKTVLTIAHRLDTIMDSDRVMVLDDGHIAQMDAPLKLLENDEGIFSGLVKAGNEQHLRAIATHGYLQACGRTCVMPTKEVQEITEEPPRGVSLRVGV